MDIESIKTRGQVEALDRAICSRIHKLSHDTFLGHQSGLTFICLGDKIHEARVLLDEMQTLLAELHKIDGESK